VSKRVYVVVDKSDEGCGCLVVLLFIAVIIGYLWITRGLH
jgi:hypothetical protein